MVENKGFMPYNEKIKYIKDSDHPLAHYIKKNQQLLKFFGEVRNHISHGIKIDGHSYTYPSHYGIQKIKQARDTIVQAPKATDFFCKEVYSCTIHDTCAQIIPKISQYNHIPVYQGQTIVGIINKDLVLHWTIQQIQQKQVYNWEKTTVEILKSSKNIEQYVFIGPQNNIHDIIDIFTKSYQKEHPCKAICITQTGTTKGKML